MLEPNDTDYLVILPLSRVFDALLDDNERPKVIISFLKMHSDEAEDILNRSYRVARIFQLDFAKRCTDDDLTWIYDFVINSKQKLYSRLFMMLSWQILSSTASTIADHLRYLFGKWSQTVRDTKVPDDGHPYRYGCGEISARYDRMIASYCMRDCLATAIAHEWTIDMLVDYMKSIQWSLYGERVLQYDVFSELSPEKKYAVLNYMTHVQHFGGKIGICEQILDSDECIEVKKKAIDILRNEYYEYKDSSDIAKILSCSSFSQMLMKCTIMNFTDISALALELLRKGRYDVLHDWVKHDKESLDANLNVSELVEEMYANMTKTKETEAI